jgi:hypothetical protein
VKVFPKGTICSVLNQHFVHGRCVGEVRAGHQIVHALTLDTNEGNVLATLAATIRQVISTAAACPKPGFPSMCKRAGC